MIKSSSGETRGTYCVAENTDGTLRLNLVISGGTLEYVYTLSDDGSTVGFSEVREQIRYISGRKPKKCGE